MSSDPRGGAHALIRRVPGPHCPTPGGKNSASQPGGDGKTPFLTCWPALPPHLRGTASSLNFETFREEEDKTFSPTQHFKPLESLSLQFLVILRALGDRSLLFSHFTDDETRDSKKDLDLPRVTQSKA